jgi:serine protease Do
MPPSAPDKIPENVMQVSPGAVLLAALLGPSLALAPPTRLPGALPGVAHHAPARVAPPTTDPAARAIATVAPAVLYVEVDWQGRVRDLSTGSLYDPALITISTRCTGFAVSNDGYLIAAGHCVDPALVTTAFSAAVADRLQQTGRLTAAARPAFLAGVANHGLLEGNTQGLPVDRSVYVQRGHAAPGRTDGEVLAAQVVDVPPSTSGDVALLKVERTNQPMVTVTSATPAAGDDVFAVGYPTIQPNREFADPVTRTGTVTGQPMVDGQPYVETNAAIAQGMDGGPLANLDGEVVGMLSRAPSGAGPPTLAAAASSIEAQLRRNGIHNDLGKVDRDYRDGLGAYYAGRYTDAIAKFDAVLALVPSHAQAQEYQQKAVSLRQSEGEPLNPQLIWIGVGVAALALLAVILLIWVLVARRRRSPGSPVAGSSVATSPAAAAPRHSAAEPTAADPPVPPPPPAPTPPLVPEPPPAPELPMPGNASAVPLFRPAEVAAPVEPPPPPSAPTAVAAAPAFSAPPVTAVPVAEPPAEAPTAPVFAEPVERSRWDLDRPAPAPSGRPELPIPVVAPEPAPEPTPRRRPPPPSMRYCPNCGHAAQAGDITCATCAQPL